MKTIKWIVPALLVLGLAQTGCVLTSAQVIATFEFADPITITGPSVLLGQNVDLNTISDYQDNKDKLKNVADLALLGEFENLGVNPISLEVLMTPDLSSHTTAAAARADPTTIPIWGPFQIQGGAKTQIKWDDSAKLFAGRKALIDQIKGDGQFTLYVLGVATQPVYSFKVHKGALVAVLEAGL